MTLNDIIFSIQLARMMKSKVYSRFEGDGGTKISNLLF
jgi:hypothetical protein